MNQRLNGVKGLEFFSRNESIPEKVSNRRPLPSDAMSPTDQNRAGARRPDQTRQHCAIIRHVTVARLRPTTIITALPRPPYPSWVLCSKRIELCALQPAHPPLADSRLLVSKMSLLFLSTSIYHTFIRIISLARTTCTTHHLFISTHCSPNTSCEAPEIRFAVFVKIELEQFLILRLKCFG